LGYRDIGIQGYWNSGILGFRDIGIQEYWDTVIMDILKGMRGYYKKVIKIQKYYQYNKVSISILVQCAVQIPLLF